MKPKQKMAEREIFLLVGICSLHKKGIGMARTMTSVRMWKTPMIMYEAGRSLQWPGSVGSQFRAIGWQIRRDVRAPPTPHMTTIAVAILKMI